MQTFSMGEQSYDFTPFDPKKVLNLQNIFYERYSHKSKSKTKNGVVMVFDSEDNGSVSMSSIVNYLVKLICRTITGNNNNYALAA